MSDIVNKLWGFCNTLRHDGVDYGDYIEQLTYLLFLKMADERGVSVPKGCDWATLKGYSGNALTDHYGEIVRKLREAEGLLGDIFAQAMPRFNNPVNLKRLLTMIDEEDWSSMDVDVKGAAFEGLLERAASEGKKGAGQFFTPRPLVQSIVRVMKPDPRVAIDCRIADPACGTGGFLMAAYEWLLEETKGALDRKDIKRIREQTYYGQELVARPRRLALMNLFLHGLQPKIYLGDTIYEPDRGERYDVILTNPPFGTKGANQAPEREDFTVETSNKQLNFVQHILALDKNGAWVGPLKKDADRLGAEAMLEFRRNVNRFGTFYREDQLQRPDSFGCAVKYRLLEPEAAAFASFLDGYRHRLMESVQATG